MISIDGSLFIFAVIDCGALLFLSVYIIATLSDLECDYLNAKQCCLKLNRWTIPEYISFFILSTLLLITGHWIMFLINLPMIVFMINQYQSIPKGSVGLYDPVSITNHGNLPFHSRKALFHIIFYLITFFIYLYNMILAVITGS